MLILLPDKCLLILLKTVISQVYCKREVECTKLVVMVVSEWGRHLQQDGIVYVLHLETSRVDLVHVRIVCFYAVQKPLQHLLCKELLLILARLVKGQKFSMSKKNQL